MKLLDSSVLVDIDRGGDPVQARAARLDREGRHAVSSVTVTELYYGVEEAYGGGADPGDPGDAYLEAVEGMETLLGRFEILPVSRAVGVKAAQVMHRLKAEGKRLDDLDDLHDVYVAATALVHQLVVLTSNTKDFDRIHDLVVEDWDAF
jgi:predicted nucleic acid-binding protein